jgi:DNA invertase Pin-like site-specific DNA recombinase
MSAVYEAHLRMLATLPVRTHAMVEPTEPVIRPGPTLLRRQRIRELLAQGVTKRRIHTIIGVSRTTVQKHLRAIKRGK